MRKKIGRLVCCSIVTWTGVLGLAVGAAAQAVPTVFAPGEFSPLTPFTDVEGSDSVLLTGRTEVLSAIRSMGGTISVALCPTSLGRPCQASEVVYEAPAAVDFARGSIQVNPHRESYSAVAVSAMLTNAFPIVTHWSQSLNEGRGGPELGGTDALGELLVDPQTGKVTAISRLPLFLLNRQRTSPYTYDTFRYALFSGDPEAANAPRPDFERYVGEDYSILPIPATAALALDNQVTRATGWPTIHRNGDGRRMSESLQPNLPAFQVLHGVPVAVTPDKASLATIVVPPFWRPDPVTPYPVVFYGFYDMNYTFASYATGTMGAVDSVMREGLGSAIIVLWNGGGSYGPVTMHRSAFDNAALLFDRVKNEVAADTDKIIAVGCSRGGGTTLAMAANPYHYNYRVPYALAYSPGGINLGMQRLSLTYPGRAFTSPRFSGYRDSWREGWISPEGLTSEQLYMQNSLGTIDPGEANAMSVNTDFFMHSLKEKGTRVSLYVGSHDAFLPFKNMLDYAEKAREHNVPLEFHVGYRFGHCAGWDRNAHVRTALAKVLRRDEAFVPGTFYYRRPSDSAPNTPERFTPRHIPAFIEAPSFVVRNKTFLVQIMGQGGMVYKLEVAKIDDTRWTAERVIEKVGNPQIFAGNLPAAGEHAEGIATAFINTTFPPSLPTGYYTYEFSYRRSPNENWQVVDKSPATGEINKNPVFEVADREPDMEGLDVYIKYSADSRGNGLSEE